MVNLFLKNVEKYKFRNILQFPLSGLARDLHPLANAHAERTQKRDATDVTSLFFIYVML